MKSTHSLFHRITSADLAGVLPYFFVDRFVRWHTSHSMTSFITASLMPGSKNVGESSRTFYPVLDEVNMCDTISQRIFGVTVK